MKKWNDIPGYIGKYQITRSGIVRNSQSGRILSPFDRKKYQKEYPGYMTVQLVDMEKTGTRRNYKNYTVHYLVLLTFEGPRPDGLVINHKNGNVHDNNLKNLEYCTHANNLKEDFIHGRKSLKGENNTQARLTENDVMVIVNTYRKGKITYKNIAKLYDVSPGAISNIFNGHCWGYLTGLSK